MIAQLESKAEALVASLAKDALDAIDIWEDEDNASTKIPISTFGGTILTGLKITFVPWLVLILASGLIVIPGVKSTKGQGNGQSRPISNNLKPLAWKDPCMMESPTNWCEIQTGYVRDLQHLSKQHILQQYKDAIQHHMIKNRMYNTVVVKDLLSYGNIDTL